MISQADVTNAQLDSLGKPIGRPQDTYGTAQHDIVYRATGIQHR